MATESTIARRRAGVPGVDYGYTNARARGMRARLLPPEMFDELMLSKDVSEVMYRLIESEYGPDLEERVLQGRTAGQVDEALKDNMVRTFRKVLGFVHEEAYLLLTTLLGRWDLLNIKTMLRGAHMHLSTDTMMESIIAVGALDEPSLLELARQDSVKGVIDTLSTWRVPYAVPLRAELRRYANTNNLAVLELAVDRYYARWATERLSSLTGEVETARRFLAVSIDTVNLLTCLRLLSADIGEMDPMTFFLTGGEHVSARLFTELATLSDVDEILDRLKRTPFGETLEAVALRYIEHPTISVFERALEDHLTRRAFASGRADALGVGVLISYLWMKANEVTNLRVIVKGVSVGMPTERIREELILV